MLQELLKKVVAGATLQEEEGFSMVGAMAGGGEPLAAAGLLACLSLRGETVPEITGAARYLREKMAIVPFHGPCADIVGTGGDGGRTFNVSTASALVAAGAGVTVAKHGNRAVSSRCGAADVLEQAGVRLERTPEELAAQLREEGVAFLFARAMHPVMAKVAPLRRALGIRTVFNLVGPLANPAHAQSMVVGVCRRELLVPFAQTLRNLGTLCALVVHSDDGLDEISSLAATHAALLRNGCIEELIIRPEEFLSEESLRTGTLEGGGPAENLRILRSILSGEDHSARRGAVLLNAAALCMVAGLGRTLSECIPLAESSLDRGAGAEVLRRMAR